MRLDSNVAGDVIGQQSLEADAEKENRTHKVERPLAILKKKMYPSFMGILENYKIAWKNGNVITVITITNHHSLHHLLVIYLHPSN